MPAVPAPWPERSGSCRSPWPLVSHYRVIWGFHFRLGVSPSESCRGKKGTKSPKHTKNYTHCVMLGAHLMLGTHTYTEIFLCVLNVLSSQHSCFHALVTHIHRNIPARFKCFVETNAHVFLNVLLNQHTCIHALDTHIHRNISVCFKCFVEPRLMCSCFVLPFCFQTFPARNHMGNSFFNTTARSWNSFVAAMNTTLNS